MFFLQIDFAAPELKRTVSGSQEFKRLLAKIEKAKIEGIPNFKTIINLIFVDDETIRRLNRQYRQKDSSTDVLSFSLWQQGEPARPGEIFGEVYISLPTALRQATTRRHSLQEELNILFVHGVLHLIGFDHENETDFQKMNRWEKLILNDK